MFICCACCYSDSKYSANYYGFGCLDGSPWPNKIPCPFRLDEPDWVWVWPLLPSDGYLAYFCSKITSISSDGISSLIKY